MFFYSPLPKIGLFEVCFFAHKKGQDFVKSIFYKLLQSVEKFIHKANLLMDYIGVWVLLRGKVKGCFLWFSTFFKSSLPDSDASYNNFQLVGFKTGLGLDSQV